LVCAIALLSIASSFASPPESVIAYDLQQAIPSNAIGIPAEKDFTTFQYLGNIGTVSLPITAAMASEREFLLPGDYVGFFGIGSGLNCIMLGIKW